MKLNDPANPLRPMRHQRFADGDGWVSACGRFVFIERADGWQIVTEQRGVQDVDHERFATRRDAEQTMLATLLSLPPAPICAPVRLRRADGPNRYETMCGRFRISRSEGRWSVSVNPSLADYRLRSDLHKVLRRYGVNNVRAVTRTGAARLLAQALHDARI